MFHRLISTVGLRLFDVYLAAVERRTQRVHAGKERSYRFATRPETSDCFVLDEVWRDRVYGPPPTGTVIDIGANIGAYAIYASQTADRVIAIEPVPANVAQLRSNLACNGITNVAVEDVAITPSGERQTIWTNRNNAGACSAYGTCGPRISARAARFNDILRKYAVTSVDVVKIDIEGMEYALLADPQSALLGCAKRIVVEFHSGWGYSGTPDTGVAMLRAAGFTVTPVQPMLTRLAGTGVWHASRA